MLYRSLLVLLSFLILAAAGCKKDEGPVNSTLPNESEVLAKHLEANGNYINGQPAFITAKQIRDGQINGTKQIVIDLRTICDYSTLGHIEGAVLLTLRQIPDYYKENNLASYEKVIITDWSGQSASYAAALLRLAGYNNVYSMMWGMTSWNKVFDIWSESIGDSHASQLETTPHEKPGESGLPALSTGKSNAAEILQARAEVLIPPAFESIQISEETVFRNLEDYYIVDYIGYEIYLAGHIPGAVQYSPGQDFLLSTYLKTLPTDKTIVLYCATGQTSAHMAAYLKLLGYDVRSLLYGRNVINHTTMMGKKFTEEEVNDFPYVLH